MRAGFPSSSGRLFAAPLPANGGAAGCGSAQSKLQRGEADLRRLETPVQRDRDVNKSDARELVSQSESVPPQRWSPVYS